jgi:hypothetical protein
MMLRGKPEILGEISVPMPLFPPQISYGMAQNFSVGSQQLIARAMIQPFLKAGINLNYTKNSAVPHRDHSPVRLISYCCTGK